MIRRLLPALPALLLLASQAQAQSVSLFPPCEPFECGDSAVLVHAARGDGAYEWEEQRVRLEFSAESMLRDTQEHIAFALMAGADAFSADGSFHTPNSPGGGLGIAIGTFDRPNCPADANGGLINLAIETFGWGDHYASRLPVCTSFPLEVLARSPALELRVSVRCYPDALCSVNGALHEAGTGALIQTIVGDGLRLANPDADRLVWAGVSNIQYDDARRGARVRLIEAHYHQER